MWLCNYEYLFIEEKSVGISADSSRIKSISKNINKVVSTMKACRNHRLAMCQWEGQAAAFHMIATEHRGHHSSRSRSSCSRSLFFTLVSPPSPMPVTPPISPNSSSRQRAGLHGRLCCGEWCLGTCNGMREGLRRGATLDKASMNNG
jgi:hypothetical protein